MKNKKVFLIELIGIAVLIGFDYLSKIWANTSLKGTDGIELIPGVLKLFYLPNGNTGAAFGIFKGQLWLFLLITVIVCILMLYVLINIPFEKKYIVLHVVLVFITAGGIGNMIDRISGGYVIDFIYFYLINFPIFNVADIYVTVSTVILGILLLFVYKEDDFKQLENYLFTPFRKKK